MEDNNDFKDRYTKVICAGLIANQTVRNFSIQVMEKAQRNYGKIEMIKRSEIGSQQPVRDRDPQ